MFSKIKSHSVLIKKILHKAIILIPLGVLGNVLLSIFTTDKTLVSSIVNFKLGFLILALVLTSVSLFTHAFRVLIWTHFIGKPLSFRKVFQIILGSDLGSAISPTAVGGAPVKAALLKQNGFNTGEALSITLLGSIEDALFFITAIPAAIIYAKAWEWPIFESVFRSIPLGRIGSRAVPGLAFLAGISFIYFLWNKHRSRTDSIKKLRRYRWKVFLSKKWIEFKFVFELIYKKGKSRLMLTYLIVFIQWCCKYNITTVLVAGLGLPADILQFFILQWIVYVFMSFVPTPGATGGAEASFYLIYKHLIGYEIIGFVTAAWRFLTYYILLTIEAILFLVLNSTSANSKAKEKNLKDVKELSFEHRG